MSQRLVKDLGKAMRSKTWTHKTNNKMRDAYGETNFATSTIRINKKKSKNSPMYKRPVNKGAKKYPDILGTIVHEEFHKNHPNATEKETRKAERRAVTTMTPAQKRKAYSRFT